MICRTGASHDSIKSLNIIPTSINGNLWVEEAHIGVAEVDTIHYI